MTIKPDYRQFIADNIAFISIAIGVAALTPLAIFLGKSQLGFLESTYGMYARVAVAATDLALWIVLMGRFAVMKAMTWTINNDTIKSQYGILKKQVDYIELYRVVDYAESQSLPQRLLRVKTVEVLSTDRSDPSLRIIGVPADLQLVNIIRKKVEICKHEKNILEVANNIH